MRIEALITKLNTNQMSGARYQVENIICKMSCHVSCVASYLSHVTKANSHSHGPLITPPLCTAGWFPKTQKSTFFCGAFLDYFRAKIANSETTSLSLLLWCSTNTFVIINKTCEGGRQTAKVFINHISEDDNVR